MNTHFGFRTALVVLATVAIAQATPIGLNQTILAVGEPDPTGGVPAAVPINAFISGGTFSGTLTSQVISGDPSNPYGGLTFIYTVANDATSADAVGRLTINGFAGFQTDVSYQTPTAAQLPTTIDRSVSGNVIGFHFVGAPFGQGAIQPGASSAVLVVQTNATTYARTIASVINGTVDMVDSYAPTPEPATLALLTIGLGLLCRRR